MFDGYSTSFTGTVAPHGVLWLMDCASGQINDVQRHKIVCFLSKKFPFVSVKWHPVVRENFDDQFVKKYLSWVQRILSVKDNGLHLFQERCFGNTSLFWQAGFLQKKPSKTNCFSEMLRFSSVFETLDKLRPIKNVAFLGASYQEQMTFHAFIDKRVKTSFVRFVWGCARNLGRYAFGVKVAFGLFWRLRALKPTSMTTVPPGQRLVLYSSCDIWEFEADNGGSLRTRYLSQLKFKQSVAGFWFEPLFLDLNAQLSRLPASQRDQLTTIASQFDASWRDVVQVFTKHIFHLFLYFCFARKRIKESFWKVDLPFPKCEIRHHVIDEIDSLMLSKYLVSHLLSILSSRLEDKLKPIAVIERKPFNDYGRMVISGFTQTKIIGIQHGILNEKQIGILQVEQELSRAFSPLCICPQPDVFFAYGRRVAKRMIKFGYPKNRVYLTGNMNYDTRLANPEKLAVKKIPNDVGPKICIFFSTPHLCQRAGLT